MIFCTLRASKTQRPIERCDNELRNSSDTQRYNFWSTSEFGESSHVTDMHVVSLLIHLNFYSKIMITKFCFWSSSDNLKLDQKWVFEQPESKDGWIRISKWIKTVMHLRHVTTSSKFWTGSKIIPSRTHQEKTGLWAQFEQFDFGCQRWPKSADHHLSENSNITCFGGVWHGGTRDIVVK